MSTHLGRKIREIRESLKLGRYEFSEKTEIPKGTLIGIETERQEPSAKALKAITNIWPQYTLWLMNDTTTPETGQISPEIEETRNNLKTVGKAS